MYLSNKCYLSQIEVSHIEVFTDWLDDMDVLKNLPLYHTITGLGTRSLSSESFLSGYSYSILDLKNNKFIGYCGFLNVDHENNKGEIGIIIGEEYRGKGYGEEALLLLLDYGFMVLLVNNIKARMFKSNKSAIKFCKKIGFKQIKANQEALHFNMEKHNIVNMEIFSKEFKKNADLKGL